MKCLLLVVLGLYLAKAYPDGSTTAACESLEPDHGVPPQTTPSLYMLVASNNGDGTYQGTVNTEHV